MGDEVMKCPGCDHELHADRLCWGTQDCECSGPRPTAPLLLSTPGSLGAWEALRPLITTAFEYQRECFLEDIKDESIDHSHLITFDFSGEVQRNICVPPKRKKEEPGPLAVTVEQARDTIEIVLFEALSRDGVRDVVFSTRLWDDTDPHHSEREDAPITTAERWKLESGCKDCLLMSLNRLGQVGLMIRQNYYGPTEDGQVAFGDTIVWYNAQPSDYVWDLRTEELCDAVAHTIEARQKRLSETHPELSGAIESLREKSRDKEAIRKVIQEAIKNHFGTDVKVLEVPIGPDRETIINELKELIREPNSIDKMMEGYKKPGANSYDS